MSDRNTNPQGHQRDLETGLSLDIDELLSSDEIEERVRSGAITREQADELLQAAARRHTAEQGPDLDTNEDGVITQGGFGSGQGMSSQSTRNGRRS